MAFRIGKSVMLNFGDNLEPIFIFTGLSFLLLIGPILRWYVAGMTQINFKLPSYFFLELLPFLLVVIASFFAPEEGFNTNKKQVIFIFGSILIFIYLHFAFYIFLSYKTLRDNQKLNGNKTLTKAHKSIRSWLQMLLVGFILIWISYFLNIIEDSVPYIIGPIMYSLVVYYLSYKAFKLKVTDLNGNIFKPNDDRILFDKIVSLIHKDKLYLETTLSLASLSKLIGKSTQKTSEVINQYAKQNFNDFINYKRIQEAKELLKDENNKNFTIASIAFDVGFSSLSSFNSAFKKFEEITPSTYRKKVFS
ncbi:helix-turn-helix domain-containing protein [Tenacibaculum sp. 190130A14a]